MSLKISRILHAGYVLECDGASIAFDPVFENPFSRNCHAFPNVEFDAEGIRKLKFSAVFLSHFHDDHCSLESLDLLDRETPIYLYCLFDELFDWIRALGFRNVFPLRLNEQVQVGPIEVIPRRALDAGVDAIFQVRAAGLNVLNVVDAWIDPDTLDLLKREGPWDFIMWPFQTMRELEVLSPSRAAPAPRTLPPEWLEQLSLLRPRFLVPSSCQFIQEEWSWYRFAYFPISYRSFQSEIEKNVPSTRVLRMNPSVSIKLTKESLEPDEPLSWMKPQGFQDVDYEYLPERPVPKTSEIARHFPPLDPAARERVRKFCETELPEKLRSLESTEEPYFQTERFWRLSLFDEEGRPAHFLYRLKGASIEPVSRLEGPLGWLTEVPLSKLWSALEEGEALTSLYTRVNDEAFEPEIEAQIRGVDVLEDPLIRCLSSGTVGAYQRAQLEKLVASNPGI